MLNKSSPQSQNQLNINSRSFIPNNINLNNIQNNQNYNMQQKNYLQNNLQMQVLNNDLNMNYNQISLEQLINRANTTFPGKFYVIKSIDESNILSSIRFKTWCSTIKGNQKLQKAY